MLRTFQRTGLLPALVYKLALLAKNRTREDRAGWKDEASPGSEHITFQP